MVNYIKHSFFLLIGLILLNLAEAQFFKKEIPTDYGYIVKLGQTVPDFDIVLPDGTKTNMQALRGKVVMLQFTASWCSVCRIEMPHIDEFNEMKKIIEELLK